MPLDRRRQHRGSSSRGGLLRRPPIDCCVFCGSPAATSHAQTSPPLARCPTMSHDPGTSSTSTSSRLVVVLLVAPCLENRKSRSGPSIHKQRPPALRLSTAIATGGGRPWCGGLPPPPGTRGGLSGRVASFSFRREMAERRVVVSCGVSGRWSWKRRSIFLAGSDTSQVRSHKRVSYLICQLLVNPLMLGME